MSIKVLSVRKYKIGYEIRTEEISIDAMSPTILKSAYTPNGDYIGSSRDANRLMVKLGITPEKADPSHNVCSIGFCKREQKWYGWSHRDIFGFGIGHVVKVGDCAAESGWTEEYLVEHPEKDKSVPVGFIVKTLDDAKRVAIAYAASVS